MKYANAINNNHLLRFFSTKGDTINEPIKNSYVSWRNLNSLEGLSDKTLLQFLNFSKRDYLKELKSSTAFFVQYRYDIDSLCEDNLFFCTECMKTGFHSYLHQYKFMTHCYVHKNKELTESCPECSEIITLHSLVSENRNPFSCKNGHSLLAEHKVTNNFKSFKFNEYSSFELYRNKGSKSIFIPPYLMDKQYV